MQRKLTSSETLQGIPFATNGFRVSWAQIKLGVTAFFTPLTQTVRKSSIRERLDILSQRMKRRNIKFNKKVFLALIIVLLLIGIGLILKRGGKLGSGLKNGFQDKRVQVAGAKAAIALNRDFEFPLKDASGEEVSKIKFTFENAELRDEIIVKGQRATSVRGRTFLILTLKITNSYNQSIEVDSKNYVRLTVNNNEGEKLAPDIHNDPVQVQADSTKFTRVGFPINDTDKNLAIYVGEIQGEKQKVELNF
ncbi:MAG: hypothetical protein A2900_02745 [Candidatus Chisholmbacteria bacterium RIFCSPLOWO2_01_FULL_50_28]|uniref:DUF4352 domain-containing protein n=1 Tax=Candidatus Chisholmbacteria bacterium RIFCSPHIGHO2_01_FULL_52_32 TaxID=1797591 RepID=A0A1G1VTI6_9BACT|nr:MAG: hypothetical protein A2786_04000 [Candidatus Chisholmbacteria bacterium RIFCSPHIGHO2_01_FULL_52_32]OGY19995.1 MAG: hypothetical protein A2900_02745 [Candidatus Chisholmbacteria bacterium RIFCSPLOWO2_01_FULL_50_28]